MLGHRFDLFYSGILLSVHGFLNFLVNKDTWSGPWTGQVIKSQNMDRATECQNEISDLGPEYLISDQISEVKFRSRNGPIKSIKIISKTILVSSTIFEVFVKEMKCVGTSRTEIAFDHQVFDKCSLFIDCL